MLYLVNGEEVIYYSIMRNIDLEFGYDVHEVCSKYLKFVDYFNRDYYILDRQNLNSITKIVNPGNGYNFSLVNKDGELMTTDKVFLGNKYMRDLKLRELLDSKEKILSKKRSSGPIPEL